MRKVYLLLTSALLLIGSSSLWAASTGTASLDGGEAIGIDEAITAWKTNGGILKLESDCEYESTSALSLTKIQTLDLNGLSLTFNTSAADAITLASAGSLTIIDSSDGKTGSLSSVSTSGSQTDIIWAQAGSTLAIEAGTFNVTNTNGKTVYALYLNSGTTGSISISGGVFENDNKTFTANVGIISGGKFAVQPAYYTPVEGKIYELVDGYYQLADGTYFVSVDNVGYSTIEDFNNALSSDPNKYSTVAVFENKDITIPAGKYAVLTQATSGQENGTFTNNGDVKFSASQTWVSGTVINNGTMAISSGTWKGTAITNSENKALTISDATWEDAQITNDGDLTVSGGTWNDAALTNNGTASLAGGNFKTALYDNLLAAGASLADGCTAYAYYSDVTYKQVLADTDVVATVSEGDNVKAFTSVSTAITYSSKDHPAVLAKDCNFSAYIYGGAERYLDLNGFTLTMSSSTIITQGLLSIEGEGTINYTGTNVAFWVYGSTESSAEKYSVLTIGENVTVNAKSGYGIVVEQSGSSNKSYGVEVHVDGNVNAEAWALDVSGNVKASTGNVPQIFVSGALKSTGAPAAYAGGYANWHFNGAEIEGTEGIYAKSGRISVVGGSVKATGAFVKDVVADCNGQKDAGDAIFMETNSCYAGGVFVEVLGDSKIESTNGYAIREAIINGTTSTAAGIAIAGENTLLEGKAGSVQMTNDFKEAMINGSSSTYDWVLNGISGGVYSKRPEVVADGYTTETRTISGKTYYAVVPKPEEPVPPASKTTYIVNDTEWDYAVEYTNSSALIIERGKTLEVKGVTVNRGDANDVSKVIVEPGATLIVGENGIQTNSADALILQSDEELGMGKLLYDGSTTATTPYGTVELYLFSKTLDETGSERIWQHFGTPTIAQPAIVKNVPVSVNNWDVQRGWIWDGGIDNLPSAWVGHNISANNPEPGSIIKFKGQLVGIEEDGLVLNKYGYNCLANSYTAPLNIKSVVNAVSEVPGCDGFLWVYDAKEALNTGIKKFSYYGSAVSEDLALAPMQGFFALHESSASNVVNIDYDEAVLGYNTRATDVADFKQATFTLVGGGEADDFTVYEGEQFSSTGIDPGYDGVQMEHGFIQLYTVQGEKKYTSKATDDIDQTTLFIKTKAATEYTLRFSGISDNYEIDLEDILTGAKIEVKNGGTYTFSAPANSVVERFRFGQSTVDVMEAEGNSINVWVANEVLNVAGAAEGDAIEVINLAGVKVLSATATGEAVQTISLNGIASGAYIVKAGAATVKVIK